MDDLEVDLLPAAETTDDGVVIRPMADGSTEVDLEPVTERPEPIDVENLAEGLEDYELHKIGQRICELVDVDIQSRQPWMDRYKQGLEMAAILGDGPPAAMEDGAKVVHPLVSEAAIQFQARALEEIFPAAGPVKATVIGESNEELDDQCKRVEAHMNWQCLEEDEGYFWDVDQMLLVVALAGSDFKKTYWDELEGMLVSRRVEAGDLIVNYRATSLKTAKRVTHRIYLNKNEMENLQAEGFYLSQARLRLQGPQGVVKQEIRESADGSEATIDPVEDGEFEVYETAIKWRLPGAKDGEPAMPYLITVDRESQKVLAIRRNWRERPDGRVVARTAFTHYKYLPGLGFYGQGLLHAIGGLGKAATDSLRALMDAAAFANFRGGFTTSDLKLKGKALKLKFGQWQEVNMSPEEIAKGFYTPDFKEPSPAIVKVLELVVMAGQRFASTTEAMTGEGNQNIPVGTTVARIEQASKVYSGIHKRLHAAAKHEFRLRAEVNRDHLDEQEFSLNGSNLRITARDYDDRIDIIPVSDPNIVSTPQRIALAQAQLELAKGNPAGFDVAEAERRYLQALKVPEIDKVQRDPSNMPSMDPVSEGAMAMTGQALKVFPEQNHPAHTAVHMAQAEMIKGTPAERVAMPILMAHINAHMAAQYRLEMSMKIGMQIPDPSAAIKDQKQIIPPEVQEAIGMAAAEAIAGMQPAEQPQQPDPESLLKLAQAKKTEAETKEVEIRTAQARVGLVAEDAPPDIGAEIDARIKPVVEQLLTAREEFDRHLQEMQREKELERVQSEAQGKVKGVTDNAALEKMRLDLKGMVDDLRRELESVRAERPAPKSEDEKAKKAEKTDKEPQPMVLNIGPITVESKGGGAKSITIKRDKDGRAIGADVAESKKDDD